MANHEINEEQEAVNKALRMIETSDPVHADIYNALFSVLINNDVFLEKLANKMVQQVMISHVMDSTNPDMVMGADQGPVITKLIEKIQDQITVLNTKIKINLEMLPNWNDVWSVSNHEFVIVHVVYNAGTAIGSPKQCYPYGILITVTSTTSVKNGWQNFQIFIEDTVNNGSETGNIFVRSNNASSSTWKKFSGTNIGIV